MITALPQLEALPPESLVLDIGGGAAHHPRADWVIDLEQWENRNWFYTDRGEVPSFHNRVSPDRWIQRDICEHDPWPFAAHQFAFAICSHTLEDVRDPVWVCHEMMRVAKAGWVTTPAAVTELTRGIESRLWCGWHHHRWLVEIRDGGLAFLAKPHHIHSPLWPAARSPRRLREGALEPLSYLWNEPFHASEEVIIQTEELDMRLRAILERETTLDPVGSAWLKTRGAFWSSYLGSRHIARQIVTKTVNRA